MRPTTTHLLTPLLLLLTTTTTATSNSDPSKGAQATITCRPSTALYDDCEVALSHILSLPKPPPIADCMAALHPNGPPPPLSPSSSPSASPSSSSSSSNSETDSIYTKTYASHRTCTIQVHDTTGALECADPAKIAGFARQVAATCGDEWDLGNEFGGVMTIRAGGQLVEIRVGGGDGRGGVRWEGERDTL